MAKPPYPETNPKETHEHIPKSNPCFLLGQTFSENSTICSTSIHSAPNIFQTLGRHRLSKHLVPTRRKQSPLQTGLREGLLQPTPFESPKFAHRFHRIPAGGEGKETGGTGIIRRRVSDKNCPERDIEKGES